MQTLGGSGQKKLVGDFLREIVEDSRLMEISKNGNWQAWPSAAAEDITSINDALAVIIADLNKFFKPSDCEVVTTNKLSLSIDWLKASSDQARTLELLKALEKFPEDILNRLRHMSVGDASGFTTLAKESYAYNRNLRDHNGRIQYLPFPVGALQQSGDTAKVYWYGSRSGKQEVFVMTNIKPTANEMTSTLDWTPTSWSGLLVDTDRADLGSPVQVLTISAMGFNIVIHTSLSQSAQDGTTSELGAWILGPGPNYKAQAWITMAMLAVCAVYAVLWDKCFGIVFAAMIAVISLACAACFYFKHETEIAARRYDLVPDNKTKQLAAGISSSKF